MKNHRNLAIVLFVIVAGFTVLLFGGARIDEYKPPIPARVVDAGGQVVFTHDDVIDGQKYYLARGGQNIGSIWGHGAMLGPDWSADALHRTALIAAGLHAGKSPKEAVRFTDADLEALEAGERGRVEAKVREELKQNRYDAATDTLTLSPAQSVAVAELARVYTALWQQGSDEISLPANMVDGPVNGRKLSAFFFWTSWAAGTNRPDADFSYTANWPFDRLAGNGPLGSSLIWSIVSVVLLLLGIGAALYYYLRNRDHDPAPLALTPLAQPTPTPSQRATLPYFLIALVLFVLQIGLGSLTAHFQVEGNKLFGLDISGVMPYAASRTWHLQLAVFWIATCWLATGLFIGPAVSGHEPKGQKTWTLVLFGALVVVVVGSLVGTLLSVLGRFGGDGFLWGHQGYEYIELGRVWQVGLIVGMLLWLALVYRAIKPTLKAENDKGGLTHLLLYASVSIPLFYSMGLFYTSGTHISNADYWRWWVVHLWVENFFEVFATVALAFVLARIGAVRQANATRAVYFSIAMYLGSGIIGTFHHLYFTGTPLFITALGATFSALEIVPLTLLGFEVHENLKLARVENGTSPYRWPLYFFVAVAFWNLVGAGVFGFLINPPIVLYYVQGLNTTPIHSHGALFGVYGFLAIALMLFSVRHIVRKEAWNDKLLKYAFWGLNGGLAGMMALSLIPAGFYQFVEAMKHGTWWARSPAVMNSEFMQTVTWLRMFPDLVFAAGALSLVAFLVLAIWKDYALRRAGGAVVELPAAEPGAAAAIRKAANSGR